VRIKILGAGFGAIALTAFVAACGHSYNGNPSADGAPVPAAATPPATAPPATAPPVSSTSDALHAWWNSGVSTDFQTVVNDYSAIKTDGGNDDETSLETDCEKLTNDVQTLQGDTAVPDPTLNTTWQTALTQYAQGGADCSTAIAAQDVQQMETSLTELTAANSSLSQFEGQLKQDLGTS
jgi:hypothetical protein